MQELERQTFIDRAELFSRIITDAQISTKDKEIAFFWLADLLRDSLELLGNNRH